MVARRPSIAVVDKLESINTGECSGVELKRNGARAALRVESAGNVKPLRLKRQSHPPM
jgi:hypothetical protein